MAVLPACYSVVLKKLKKLLKAKTLKLAKENEIEKYTAADNYFPGL